MVCDDDFLTVSLGIDDLNLIFSLFLRIYFAVKPNVLKKRKIELAVISDVHLGTYGCHADELIAYLNSIQPKKLILNGDIIDIWPV